MNTKDKRIAQLEAEVKMLRVMYKSSCNRAEKAETHAEANRKAWTIAEAEVERRLRELHSLADIALDRGCECEPNGESCPGHAFLELWKLTINDGGRESGETAVDRNPPAGPRQPRQEPTAAVNPAALCPECGCNLNLCEECPDIHAARKERDG